MTLAVDCERDWPEVHRSALFIREMWVTSTRFNRNAMKTSCRQSVSN